MALFPVTSNPSWRQAAILDNFEWPHLRNGSFAVIFAIAQLSCFVLQSIFLILLGLRRCEMSNESTMNTLPRRSMRSRSRLIFLARDTIMLIALYAIVRPSVRLSHGWISQKRLKLGLCNSHHASSFCVTSFIHTLVSYTAPIALQWVG